MEPSLTPASNKKKYIVGGIIAFVTIGLITGTVIWWKKGGDITIKSKLAGMKKSGTVKAKDFFDKEDLAIIAKDKNKK